MGTRPIFLVQGANVSPLKRGIEMFKNERVKRNFKKHGNKFTTAQYELADEILTFCHTNYGNGGDIIVECYEFEEILDSFKTLEDVKTFIDTQLDREKDCRWGEDNDPELSRSADNWE